MAYFFLFRDQHDVVVEYVILALPNRLRPLQRVGDRLGHVQVEVRVGAVLHQGECEVVHVLDVAAIPHVVHHLHAHLENVLVAAVYPEIGVQTVRQQQHEQVFDELEVDLLLLVAAQRQVLRDGEHENVERGEVRAIRAARVGVRAVLQQDSYAVQIAHFHVVGEVVQRVLVDQQHQADHDRNRPVASHHIRLTCNNHRPSKLPHFHLRDFPYLLRSSACLVARSRRPSRARGAARRPPRSCLPGLWIAWRRTGAGTGPSAGCPICSTCSTRIGPPLGRTV